MTMRKLMLAAIAASAVGGAGAQADQQIQLAVGGDSIAEIKVDGDSYHGPYDKVRTDTLRYIVSVRGAWNYQGSGRPPFTAWIAPHAVGHAVSDDLMTNWVKYQVSRPYIDPLSPQAVNLRLSPVDLCNARLQQTQGQAREQFLKTGVTFVHQNAYEVGGNVYVLPQDAFNPNTSNYVTIKVPAKIVCMPLNRPRPHTQTGTTGAPGPTGKPLPPTISKATLRIEPAKIVQDGKFLCPSQLKLYGHVESIREFHGKALFVGPHYLSNITTLNFQAKGNRNVTATYTMNWHQTGGLTIAPNAEPKKQTLTFRFNIANKDGKLLESAEETVEVSCRKIKVNAPAAGDGMTVAPAN